MREVVEAEVSWRKGARAVAASTESGGTEPPSGGDCGRPPADAIATELTALAPHLVALDACHRSQPSVSLIGCARTATADRQGDQPCGRSYRASADDAGRTGGTGRQSRSPSGGAFASSVAVGLGMRTPAAEPATSSQYSDSRRPRERLATLTRIVHWPVVLEVGNGRRASPDHSELIAPGGADDAEDVLVCLADEAGFEWCTSHICRSRAVRSWPPLNRRPRERRRRVVTSSDR